MLIRDLERISRTARSIHLKAHTVHPDAEETQILEQAAAKLHALHQQQAAILRLSCTVQAPVLQQITRDVLIKSQVRSLPCCPVSLAAERGSPACIACG